MQAASMDAASLKAGAVADTDENLDDLMAQLNAMSR